MDNLSKELHVVYAMAFATQGNWDSVTKVCSTIFLVEILLGSGQSAFYLNLSQSDDPIPQNTQIPRVHR